MGRFFRVIAVSLVVLLPQACQAPIGNDKGKADAPSEAVVETSDLFVVQTDGSCTFSTNDPAYWGPYGYTLWAMPCPAQPTFTQRDVLLTKQSGNLTAGYGIVFCQYSTANQANDETMLIVMINAKQQYSVGEATGSVYTPYTTPMWVEDKILSGGIGMNNEVKVTRESDGNFSLFLNGKQAMSFSDGRRPLQTGGGEGYLVVISPQDSFPANPVTVTFKDN